MPQHVAQASEDAKTAYDLAISCQHYSCLVADKFADLTRKLRFACLNSDVAFIASINEYRNDVKQMDEWHDLAAAKSKEAAVSIRRALVLMGIAQKDEEIRLSPVN